MININANAIQGFIKNWLSFLSDLTGYPIERVNRVGVLFFFGIIIPIACFFLCWLVLDLSFIVSLLLAFSIYLVVIFFPMLL